ncbi:hypothetical protein FFK22_026525 [Mycobacterium sp. KBS0706]|uniref:HNH endonuclease n=1 Tax=Mycobacterium sp. KBS0706 TaxID=2578109 RepID=UPI00110F86C3|nr:HNH endonuclease [Mycobacterium sp. KBS0706]TSD85604.1 hypothetical protein FFK22_026525 [Mycobacterium sp. KBS0706]
MASEEEWTDEELAAAVTAYLAMLRLELSHTPYVKAKFREKLLASSLSRRTKSSIEFRMRNISSVMQTMKLPHIEGYWPADNIGSTNEARLRRIIVDAGGLDRPEKRTSTLHDLVAIPELLMGVKAVYGVLGSHVICFGRRGEIGSKSYFSVAAGAARRAVTRPFIVAIGGGANVREGLEGRVLNLARAALVYGPTEKLVTDPAEVEKLAQWPVALALHDVWRFVDPPHLIEDLGFPDRTILVGAQDGIVHPDGAMGRLWAALRDWPVELAALPSPSNFYDAGTPRLVGERLPTIPASTGVEEGERIWNLQLRIERDPLVATAAKHLNLAKYGRSTCEACSFTHDDHAMFDAHHPTPLSMGRRTTLPEHLQILCPTCHRRAHRKGTLEPYTLEELRGWVASGRP